MKPAAAFLALALGACSTGADTSHDYYGNVYPADCPASITSDAYLLSRVTITKRHTSGAYGTTSIDGKRITQSPALSGWRLEDNTRHELCHAKRLQAGLPDWHALHVPNVYRAPVCTNTFHC